MWGGKYFELRVCHVAKAARCLKQHDGEEKLLTPPMDPPKGVATIAVG